MTEALAHAVDEVLRTLEPLTPNERIRVVKAAFILLGDEQALYTLAKFRAPDASALLHQAAAKSAAGRKGARERSRSLSPERRKEIAQNAARARWKR